MNTDEIRGISKEWRQAEMEKGEELDILYTLYIFLDLVKQIYFSPFKHKLSWGIYKQNALYLVS